MQKIIGIKYLILTFILFFLGGIIIAFEQAKFFENEMLITREEINDFSKKSIVNFLEIESEDLAVKTSTMKSCDVVSSKLDLNLFGFIKIKTVDVNVSNTDLILCGNTVGIYLENNGVTVVGFGGVKSNNTTIYPFENSDLKVGDIITSINDKKVYSSADIDNILSSSEYSGGEIVIEYLSNSKLHYEYLSPVYDAVARQYKLGLWIRENATGIGTLTYVTQNNKFGALGHGITENGQTSPMSVSGGSLHQCDVLGITKGKRGSAGEIRAMFLSGAEDQGIVEKNNEYGVFGTIKENSIFKNGEKLEIGGRLTAKPGKAYIYCQLDGDRIEKYEIEIIKTNYQSKSNQKSMVLRVIDKALIEKTGGIIQGMSGSPIVQNGKIIGAVTHVFINDPTKGFGIYLDWMLNE